MAWKIEWVNEAVKDLRKLGRPAQTQIRNYLRNRIATGEDPRAYGKPLAGNLSGMWSYRVGDYRVICRMINDELTVLVVSVGHRKDVYKR
jgi:mRNA interferase RelE/StbE